MILQKKKKKKTSSVTKPPKITKRYPPTKKAKKQKKKIAKFNVQLSGFLYYIFKVELFPSTLLNYMKLHVILKYTTM